jgi:hypothetical protein
VQPNGPGKKVTLYNTYPEGDHYVIETEEGAIDIREICFCGELSIEEKLVPLAVTSTYEHFGNGGLISQYAAFAPQEMPGGKFSLELHRIGEDGETHILLRRA